MRVAAPPPDAPIWAPEPARRAGSRLAEFARAAEAFGAPRTWMEEEARLDYAALHAWSLAEPRRFWGAVWRFCDVLAEGGPTPASPGACVGLERMAPPDPALGPRWFTEARLNFAENLLRRKDDHPALVSWDETGRRGSVSYAELNRQVARCAAGLRRLGIGPGDRVAAYLPNLPETVVAMLAATSIGAIWSSTSPDFGVEAVIDRFGQIGPRVLFAADRYRYQGREIDCLPRVDEIARRIPSVERTVIVPYAAGRPRLDGVAGAVGWEDFGVNGEPEPRFERLPFDHPLAVLYSSGTTGLPKGIVHGAGGTLLQHLKELVLHADLRPDDRIFYFTTCGWMMWNWLVSGLAVGATVVLYDGSPLAPGLPPGETARPAPHILWDLAEAEGVTVFGTSAKYLARIEKEGLEPARTHSLHSLRAVLSTGSPLAGHGFDYVYGRIKRDVQVASISGGTDIVSCFVLGIPTEPVWRGEIQGPGLGMAVEIWSEEGRRVRGEPGELVCTRPFPSMPVAFWDDPDGARYRRAYFEHFPGVWRHGDWAEETVHGGFVIYGRSDATLNPGGVRIGTAEIYRQVEQLDEVLESVAVGRETGQGAPGDVRVVLFVRLRPGLTLDTALEERIRRRIRENASPHHVPHQIVQVADIPRTISGKVSEIAVREVLHGRPVRNVDALANPESLELYRALPEPTDAR